MPLSPTPASTPVSLRIMHTFKDKDGSIIEVPTERWQWGVVYNDGTELHQFDSSGVFHQIGEVDQDRATMFTLFRPDDPTRRIDVPVLPGMRLIHKYVNVRPAGYEHFIRVYCIGYKHDGHHHFTYVLPDDRIITSATDTVDFIQFGITH